MGVTGRCPLPVAIGLILILPGLADSSPESPPRESRYLGEKPPGLTPQVFAPELLSKTKPEWAYCAVIAPGYDALFHTAYDVEREIDRILWMRRIGGEWVGPEPAPFDDGVHSSNDPRVSPDGSTFFFRSQRPLPGNAAPEPHLFTWYVTKNADGWSEPLPLLLGGASRRISHLGVASNGTLYFSLRSEGNVGEADLHRSLLVNGSYGDPENLGPEVNTRFSEGDTFVAPDESLLVVTVWDRPDNNGESDLYLSRRRSDGSWTELRNLGGPINTSGNENCAAISPDGRFFYYVTVVDEQPPSIATYWVDAGVLELQEMLED